MQTDLRIIQENTELKLEISRLKEQNAKLTTQVKEFDVYDVVNSQIEKSRIPRFNWKKVFGHSLTKLVAEHYGKGYNANQSYTEIKTKLLSMSIDNPEILRRLKISVSSRFAEIQSESKKINEVKNARKSN